MTKQEKLDRKNARLRVSRGCFKVSFELMRQGPAAIMAIMRGVLVTDAQSTWCDQTITYHGMSRHFEPWDPNCVAPVYSATVTEQGNKVTVRWQRIGGKGPDQFEQAKVARIAKAKWVRRGKQAARATGTTWEKVLLKVGLN